jgi:hypothetical protein
MNNAMSSLTFLVDRREKLPKQFFKSLSMSTNCLHQLLPAKRNSTVVAELCQASQYSGFTARTERFKNSAMSFALNNSSDFYKLLLSLNVRQTWYRPKPLF